MITFTRAIAVRPGQRHSSRHHNSLARAVNERLVSGLGDGCFRIAQFLLGLFRAPVVGDLDGKTRAEGEYFEAYQAVAPNVANWPVAGVDPGSGLPEEGGPNLANPIMAWVYGVKSRDIDPESTRVNAVPVAHLDDPDEAKWNAAKEQRGAIDPITGYVVSPMRHLALSVMRFAFPRGDQWNTSYGGFLPGPDKLSEWCVPPCDLSADCNTFRRDNLDIFFTATRPDVSDAGLHVDGAKTESVPWALDPGQSCLRVHYAGTCLPCIGADAEDRCGAGNYGTHINLYRELPDGYEVMLNDGTVDFLPRNDWIEGPYEQVRRLSRDLGEQLGRAIHKFVCQFRGTDSQQADRFNRALAFPNQTFFTRPFALAPARGQKVGDGLEVLYPAWRIDEGSHPAGAQLDFVTGGKSHTWWNGYVCTHLFCVVRSEEPKRVALRITHADGSFVVTATEAGAISPVSTAASLRDVKVELVDAMVLAAGESVEVEMTELYRYLPNWWDAYAVLRKGAARLVGENGADVDGNGLDEDLAGVIGSQLLGTGCAVNVHEVTGISDPTSENENAVAEAARAWSKVVKIVNRFAVLDYAVEGGDSVLWLCPHPRTDGHPMISPEDDGDPDVDLFADLTVGDAAPGGFSSGWVMDAWFKAFHNDGGSTWRPEVYGDQFLDVNRCGFLDSVSGMYDAMFARHINRNQPYEGSGLFFAQMPSGWNYAQLLQDRTKFINHNVGAADDVRKNWARSCRIYEPPVELRRVERETRRGRDVVKVVFKGRLHNTQGQPDGAPVSIPPSGWLDDPTGPGNWDHAEILGEPFRTAENAIRLYLCWRWSGDLPPLQSSNVPGDRSITSFDGIPGDGLMASILPHLVFVKLVPLAYVDRNDSPDPSDSPMSHETMQQVELYLRAMAEGAVAAEGTLDCSDPEKSRAYDWSWSSLCNATFGFRSVGAFGSRTTSRLVAGDVRPDGPSGYGPMPNTFPAAEVFNRLVGIANSLTRYRVMLPWKAERRTGLASAQVLVQGGAGEDPIDYGCGPTTECGPDSLIASNTAPDPAHGVTWGDWEEFTDPYASAQTGAAFPNDAGGCVPSGEHSLWPLTTIRQVAELRFTLIDWDIYQHAVPPSWRDMVSGASENVGALFSRREEVVWNEVATGSTDCLAGSTCQFVERTAVSDQCWFMKNGTARLDAGPTPPGGWFFTAFDGGLNTCGGGSIRMITAQLMGDTCPILEVELVDREEWEDAAWLVG